jgi:hypothetical protein
MSFNENFFAYKREKSNKKKKKKKREENTENEKKRPIERIEPNRREHKPRAM